MRASFMVEMSRRLDLERAVFDVKVPSEAGLQLVEDSRNATVAEAGVVDYHVSGECWEIGRDRPGVQVVDIADMFDTE